MSESCVSKVRSLSGDQVTRITYNCDRELGHEGRHRAVQTAAPVSFLEWGDEVGSPAPPTCSHVQSVEPGKSGLAYQCRLPAGHPMWHFSGLVAWPRSEP